ncbi:MAG TPA: AraC family transcriptional regulator, partial [Cyclobacteriaceae bacterium]
TPKLYGKINRFQHSLGLINQKDTSLTDIAYEAGYFDQSHFIREFKSFTGVTPSSYSPQSFPISFAFANG